MKHFSWLNKNGTTETCCTTGLCMAKDSDERIRLLQKIARDHSKEDRIKEMEEGNEDEIKEEEKEKHLESIRKSLRKLTSQELDEELIRLSKELEEIKKKLNPDEEKEDKDTKQASVEFIGVNEYHSVSKDGDDAIDELMTLQNQRHRKKKLKHSQSYNVLTLTDTNNSVNGDELFIKQGSVD